MREIKFVWWLVLFIPVFDLFYSLRVTEP